MFNFKKQKNEFLFHEVGEMVFVYEKSSNKIQKIFEFSFDTLVDSLEKLKKISSGVSNGKLYWILKGRLENIEKTPLGKTEMVNYAKWKIQELVDIPMHDISYDILTNNFSEANFYKKFATAIIVKKAKIDAILTAFTKNKLTLFSIDHQSTALLDIFLKEENSLKQKSFAVVSLDNKRMTIQIYYEKGIVFERNVEFPFEINPENLPEDRLSTLLDKISLEMQRNIDFIDRQYGIPYFESILFSSPNDDCFVRIQKEIAENFNVKVLECAEFTGVSFVDTVPSIYVYGGFERGKYSTEQINLKPFVSKEIKFEDELKKTLAIVLVTGTIVSVAGAVYEMQAKSLKEQNFELSNQLNREEKKIAEERNKTILVDQNIEKDIARLIKNKAEILALNAEKNQKNVEYFVLLKDISIAAKESNVGLNLIKITDSGIRLEGITYEKNKFINFVNHLKMSPSLKGINLDDISIEESSDKIVFKISSMGLGEKK